MGLHHLHHEMVASIEIFGTILGGLSDEEDQEARRQESVLKSRLFRKALPKMRRKACLH
jgi:hypothetical protein